MVRTLSMIVAILSGPCFACAAEPRPHVLVIHADQFRFDCLGVMGHPDVRTPNLDALARDGVLFRNSFCTWPVCTPSRYSLLSGQTVSQHRGRTNRATLPPGTPTFASLLRAGGYTTAAVGKMHFTPAYLDVGFSRLLLAEQNGRGRLVDDYHRDLRAHGLIDSVDLIDQEQPYRGRAGDSYWKSFGAGVSNLPEAQHSTTWIGDRAVEALGQWSAQQPCLLMAGFIKPHHPFDPPERWHALYDPARLTVLPGWTDPPLDRDLAYRPGYFDNRTLTLPALRQVMADYYATISQVDAQVGRMLDALKRQRLYDQTLIVFTSDHGEYLGFHHLILKGNLMYDPLVKVPLILKFPRQKHAGQSSDALVSSIDVTRTILDEAGIKPGPDMHGLPLEAVAAGKSPGRSFVFTEDSGMVMVRSRTRKLLYSPRPGRSLFFDLERDPYELEDRIDDASASRDVQSMTQALLRWLVADDRSGPYVDLEAKQIERPNVPRDRVAVEQSMQQYIDQMMDKVQAQGKREARP